MFRIYGLHLKQKRLQENIKYQVDMRVLNLSGTTLILALMPDIFRGPPYHRSLLKSPDL